MKKGKFDIAKLDLSNNVEMIKTDEGKIGRAHV